MLILNFKFFGSSQTWILYHLNSIGSQQLSIESKIVLNSCRNHAPLLASDINVECSRRALCAIEHVSPAFSRV